MNCVCVPMCRCVWCVFVFAFEFAGVIVTSVQGLLLFHALRKMEVSLSQLSSSRLRRSSLYFLRRVGVRALLHLVAVSMVSFLDINDYFLIVMQIAMHVFINWNTWDQLLWEYCLPENCGTPGHTAAPVQRLTDDHDPEAWAMVTRDDDEPVYVELMAAPMAASAERYLAHSVLTRRESDVDPDG
jgi:hypothetical protein